MGVCELSRRILLLKVVQAYPSRLDGSLHFSHTNGLPDVELSSFAKGQGVWLGRPSWDSLRSLVWVSVLDSFACSFPTLFRSYFLWDTIESIVHYAGIGLIAHGASCLTIYTLAYVSIALLRSTSIPF